ncbi:MAG: DUF1540 domain-containing protein [Clostridiales bacterium]|jgi:hypothetical protein|nr:DUF1540 domain-containing protein [Clostridiales bacterium]
MTTLGCNVMNCAYYKDSLCCRPDIQVSGPRAGTSRETCCSSFTKASDGAQNSVSYALPNTSVEVRCDVKSCAFNSRERCGAEQISICAEDEGGSAPEQNSECGSFRPK